MGVLEQALKRNVDVIKEGALLPFAVESAQRERILIYGDAFAVRFSRRVLLHRFP